MKSIVFLFFFVTQVLFAQAPPPNILWITCEDISPTLSMYGDSTAKTPNLDKLSGQSIVYLNAFSNVGVCGPSRSSIITGMHPTSIGTMHMRTGRDVQHWGTRTYSKDIGRVDLVGDTIIEYSAVLPDAVRCFTEYLRAEGYYCTNNQKTDYQFAAPLTSWDENGPNAHWRNRLPGTPFFSVFNIGLTHESRLWEFANRPLTVSPDFVPVPPYLPDNEATRKSVARHYSNVELMDAEVGKILKQLKDDGLYENTVIFFYSDHGGPLPRQKREIYDSGLRVPFLVKYPGSGKKGPTTRLISFVDLAPTVLSIAGIKPQAYMEGRAFLGKFEASPREYIFGSSDRFDEYSDRIRIVRDKNLLYVRNFLPALPKYKDLSYRKNIPMMDHFLNLRDKKQLNAIQQIWFEAKTIEELYDCAKDPHNVHNLIDDPAYVADLHRLRKTLFDRMVQRPDLGFLPEAQLVDMMWPGFVQPKTAKPEIRQIGGKVTLSCSTPGASIAYRFSDSAGDTLNMNAGWKLYTKPFLPQKGKHLYAAAERTGYHISDLATLKLN